MADNPEYESRARIIGRLAASFPSVVVTDETIDVYVRELYHVPISMLQRAVAQALDTARFFPTIAELREKIDAMVSNEPKPPAFNCQFCFGSGWEQYMLEGYNTARRCSH